MNKLDKIIAEVYGCKTIKEVVKDFDISPSMIKECMVKSMKMILEEAAENAKLKVMKKSQHSKNPRWKNADSETEIDLFDYEVQYLVNKKSITGTLNKYYETDK